MPKPLAWATIYSQPGREDMVEVGPANPGRERQAETWGWSHRRVPLVAIPSDQVLVPKELIRRACQSPDSIAAIEDAAEARAELRTLHP